MPTSFEQFAADYADLANDVINAGYETYETKLTDWLDFIEREPISKDRIANLQQGFDFDAWYEAAKATVGSMVGSGRLDWAKDRTERLGQQLALFKHFTANDFSWSDFTSNFLWAGSRYNDSIRKLNSELFEPFARDLLKDIQRSGTAHQASPEIPAADRIVTLDHNARPYVQAVNGLDQVMDDLQRSNEIGADDPSTRERIVAELDAGRRLLKASQVRAQAVWAVVYPALRWLADNTASTTLGVAVTAVIVLLAKLLGFDIPGL